MAFLVTTKQEEAELSRVDETERTAFKILADYDPSVESHRAQQLAEMIEECMIEFHLHRFTLF